MPTALPVPGARRALAGVLLVTLAAAGLRVGGTENTGALVVGGGLLIAGLVAIAVAVRGSGADSPVNRGPSEAAPLPFSGTVGLLLSVHVAGALLALALPHLHLLGLSVIIAVTAGALLEWRLNGKAVRQVGQGVMLLLFLGSWYALASVAGEAPLALKLLGDAPYSEAFAVTVALPLALATWPMLGLFPFHRTRLGPFSALVGAALLVRVAAVAVPSGLEHWQPLLYLLLVVAMAHALFRRDDAEALAALAGLGLLSGETAAGWCGLGLAAGVALIRSRPLLTAAGRVLNSRGEALARGLTVTGALLLVPVLSGGLAAEAVYTVTVTLGGAFLLWKR